MTALHTGGRSAADIDAGGVLGGYTGVIVRDGGSELAAIIRGHWLIEDRLHRVRDMDWDEDRSQVRTGNGPRVMASLQPGHHHLAPDRPNQHRRRFALPRAPARQAPANDHELLERA